MIELACNTITARLTTVIRYWQWRVLFPTPQLISSSGRLLSHSCVCSTVQAYTAKGDSGITSPPMLLSYNTIRHQMSMCLTSAQNHTSSSLAYRTSRSYGQNREIMNVKACILAQFGPENLFPAKIKEKMLVLTKITMLNFPKISPSLKLAMAKASHQYRS